MIHKTSDSGLFPRAERLERAAWGIVFCGGESRRMGQDKARLSYAGESLVERAVRTLGAVTPRVLLASGRAPRYAELGLECVLDEQAGVGPLAGLAAGLERLAAEGLEHACVLACDMPNASAALYRALLARARASGAEVCLLRTAAGTEPLCGVYHVGARAAVRAALARGERRMNSFHPALRVESLCDEHGWAQNLNTPEQYRAAAGGSA